MTLGEKIYNLRKEQGISQEKLEEKTGVSRQTVHKWESDAAQPTAENMALLAEALGADQNELIRLLYPIQESGKDEPEQGKRVEAEIAVTEQKGNTENKSKRIYICLAVVIGIILTIFVGITIWYGFAADLKKSGDIVESNYYINFNKFFIVLCITIILFIAESILLFRLKRGRRNKK